MTKFSGRKGCEIPPKISEIMQVLGIVIPANFARCRLNKRNLIYSINYVLIGRVLAPNSTPLKINVVSSSITQNGNPESWSFRILTIHLHPWKLRWRAGKSPWINRKYNIFIHSWWVFHCHVSFFQGIFQGLWTPQPGTPAFALVVGESISPPRKGFQDGLPMDVSGALNL